MSSELRTAQTLCIQVSTEIHAPVPRVWKHFIRDIANWWALAKFNATAGSMFLEPHAGGRLYEAAPSGHELLWGRVLEVLPEQRLFIYAAMGAPYAPAAITLYQFNFESTGKGTRVSIRDELIGNLDEKTAKSMTDGWTTLLNKGLKAYVEAQSAP